MDDRSPVEGVSPTGAAELIRRRRHREINARLYRKIWTEAGLAAVGPLLERAEDVMISVTPQRWSAWDIRSTFFAAVQEAGIPLDDAELVPVLTWGASRQVMLLCSSRDRNRGLV